jgi:hypothetical protein
MIKLATAQLHYNFPLFHFARKFPQTFSNTFQALLSVELDLVLKSWSSNSSLICGPMKTPSFLLASHILGKFSLKEPNPSL